MQELLEQTETVLQTYLHRGTLAVTALDADDEEAADQALKLRKAAFANFRILEHKLVSAGFEIKNEKSLMNLISQAFESDDTLRDAIKKHQERLVKKLSTMKTNRSKLSKYYSGRRDSTGFENSA